MAKILIVEDDNNLREIYGARLKAEGYDIVAAPDGEEALAVAVKEKPDLIIADIMMPKISGFDMLDILRNAPETKDTKIIMMTALSQAEDKERADKLGADLYLVKSQVTLEDVAGAVHKMLNDSPASSEPAAQAQQNPAANTPSTEQLAAPPAQQTAPEPVQQPAPSITSPVAESPPVPPSLAPASPPTAPAAATTVVPTPPPATDNKSGSDNAGQSQATPPAANPQPTTAPPVDQTPVSNVPATPTEPKKIEVTAPDSEEKPVEQPVNPTAQAPDIGPSVAEALAEEAKTSQDQPADNTGGAKAASPAPASTEPSTVIKPQVTSDSSAKTDDSQDDQAPSYQPAPEKPTNEDGTGKKIIQPLNDPTKGPDLEALLAKEEQLENGDVAPNPTQPPVESSTGNNTEKPPENPDDLSKISL